MSTIKTDKIIPIGLTLTVEGSAVFTAGISANSTMSVGGAAVFGAGISANSTMSVGGAAVFGAGISANSTMSVGGAVTATSFAGNGTIPIGGIIMWSGSTIPTGWAFCDGTTVNGTLTPNLTNKFIISRSADTVTTTTITGVATSTGGSTTIPNHKHWLGRSLSGQDDAKFNARNTTDAILDAIPSEGSSFNMNGAGNSEGGLVGGNAFTNTGLYGLITSKTIVDQETVNLPPYYALAFIMRIA